MPMPHALRSMLRHPVELLRAWNWKAALFSALLRGLIFFAANLHGGTALAARAMLVEVLYATVAAGCAGAVTQRLRHAIPRAATALVVWLAIPAVMLAAQAAVHRALHTPHLRTGLIVSFLFASCASGFTWFAMSRGVFVTGEKRPFIRDLLLVPGLILQFFGGGFTPSSHGITNGRRTLE